MSIGIDLSDEDLQAVRRLYEVRWSATIQNWKERDTDYCQWQVTCPDLTGHWITETGLSLEAVIANLLDKL